MTIIYILECGIIGNPALTCRCRTRHLHVLRLDPETMLAWAKSMTWKGRSPVVEVSHKEYPRGITLGKKAMHAIESRLERHLELPKWDILIRPAAPD